MSTAAQHGSGGARDEQDPRAPERALPPEAGAAGVAAGVADAMAGIAGVEDLAAHLGALPDADVVALLAARPDLAVPPSSSFTVLAARAGGRPSVETALADLDAPTLAVAEAVVALGTRDSQALAEVLGLGVEDVGARLGRLARLALVIGAGPVTGLVDAFGPHPFGLGPGTADPPSLPPSLEELRRDPEGLPREALGMLEALAWGPPVGTLRAGSRAPGADELVDRGWLVRERDAAGRTRLVMPRRVSLALRGGLLPREPLVVPDAAGPETLGADVVAAEASRRAEEAVRLVGALLAEWGREGGAILRTGGVGVRALTRTAEALDVEPATAAALIETAASAGLLGLDEAGAAWVPSSGAAPWLEAALPERWAALVIPWATSARTAWLVGRRGDDGSLRPVLGADVEAAWARALRRRILLLLDSLPQGAVITPAGARDALTFARPRRPVPEGAVAAVLAEAELLGLTGGGALSRAGRILARSLDRAADAPRDADPDDAGAGAGRAAEPGGDGSLAVRLEEALAEDLPEPVDTLLVQSDLTAIVPGRPVAALAELVERCSVVESRGGALTVRFTADSVRTALDAGVSGPELIARLAEHSPTPLPSALTALIEDAARRHGAVRVREVASVLRVEDPAVAAGLVAQARLADLGLVEIAPGVLVSRAPSGRVLRELRSTGLAPVLEDASGRLLVAGGPGRARRAGAGAPEPTVPGEQHAVRRPRPGRRELAALVGRMRAGEQARTASGAPEGAATDPVHALALLRQAQATRSQLRLRLAGADGTVQERRARVLSVEAGRVRIVDLVRQTELTVATHRIAAVEAL